MKNKKIIILGSGPSLSLYKYSENDFIFCPYAMKTDLFDRPNITYFEMHEEINQDSVISQSQYPLNEIIDFFGCSFFTNSVSYIIAYCLFYNVEEIEMHGVDMVGMDEYVNQRGSILYWVGRAEGLGVKVTIPNGIKETFLYGYEEKKKAGLIHKINYLTSHAEKQLKLTNDENTKNQYIGFIHAMRMLKNMEL